MLMELAFRLAVEESPFIQTIRNNAIFVFTPATEVDGREKRVDNFRAQAAGAAGARAWSIGASTSRTTTTATAIGWGCG